MLGGSFMGMCSKNMWMRTSGNQEELAVGLGRFFLNDQILFQPPGKPQLVQAYLIIIS